MTWQESEQFSPKESAQAQREVDHSFEQDAERAKDSYTQHTATALRRRALAALNGQ